MNMIKKLFNKNILNTKPSSSIASAAFIITTAGLASRALGLLRDRFLAGAFGAGNTLDVYYAAFRVPDLVYNLLIFGALSAAFIPVFAGLISQKKDDEAWEVANGVMNLAVMVIIILAVVLGIFAPELMKIITPGFPPEKITETVLFTRIMFLSPLLLGVSGIFGGILTSFRRFLIYSIAPLFYNLGIIIGILVFVRFMGPVGLAWGVVLGAAMHLTVQYFAVKNLGYRHVWLSRGHLINKDVRKVIKLMIPQTMGIAIIQFNLFIITIFASTLAAGSLSIINFAQNLQSVPVGLFGASFAIAVFPTLSASFAKNDHSDFIRYFSETFRQILFFIIPSTVFVILLKAQLVRVVLGTGKFDWTDTVLTFQVLQIFALSLFAQCLTPLLARAFYSMHDTKTPFYMAAFSELINIICILNFIHPFGIMGLAWAFSISTMVETLALLFFIRMRLENLDDKEILRSLAKIALASILAGIGIQITKYAVNEVVNIDTFLGIFSQLAVSSGVGIAIFLLACQVFQIEEFMSFKNSLTKRLFRSRKNIIEDLGDVSGM
ncbi:MAG: murein biosynthesis integral membrane protein MurJ [Candidatus Pacebacteria bacterium]|nr:murein biosynthesis integral membrane protein MurJ [Candidatus Paceibacterota bacterium]MDR3582755.1 murein biosynthesis integral membrane protein MurJ [Candidatus Paceibacterota bacterium]